MGTLRTWWNKLTGKESAPETATRKPLSPPRPKAQEGLQLVDDLPAQTNPI